ncbi:MAG: polyphosphate kinase 2 family protein [Clostridiales bacterium]|nr:polyphosphate kinase 2 family protein [Candidatus Blautia equi]
MSLKTYKVDGSKKFSLSKLPTDSKKDKVDKEEILRKTEENQQKISELQERLYAEGKEGLIIVLQAIDAAGKDSTIKHVMSGINPQGVDVVSFKTPTSEELAHDFLWRVNKHLPLRGKIAIFNRSYYEDVLVVQVHDMNKGYHMADRVIGQDKDVFFKKRYKHIRDYEEYLFDNSYRIVKIFLNVSKEEQKNRFLERIDVPEKNWKFSAGDLKERALWDTYHEVYEDVINETASRESPWYVLPADQKWYTRYLVSQIIRKTLEKIDPQYPDMPEEEKAILADCRRQLMEEE